MWTSEPGSEHDDADPMIWQFIDSSSVGGAERHIATLADGLRRTGHPVEIVLLADHGSLMAPNPWLRQLDAAGLPYRHLDGSFGAIVKALQTDKPQLLHTHGYKAGILGRVAARWAGVPVVSTFHSGARGPWPVGAYEALDDWTSCLGGRIVVSETIRRRLPFAADVIPSYVTPPPAPSAEPSPKVAAFVGRLSAEKAPDLFCALAARARQRGDTALSWQIWGDGPMRRELEATYSGVAIFHGIAADMDAVWRRIGLLVMPSHFEGVPLAALEAAAHGIPVLASRVGGLPSVVDEHKTGWLFPVGDLAAAEAGLAAWQRAVTADDASLRRACWDKARRDFSEDRWLPAVLAAYRRQAAIVRA